MHNHYWNESSRYKSSHKIEREKNKERERDKSRASSCIIRYKICKIEIMFGTWEPSLSFVQRTSSCATTELSHIMQLMCHTLVTNFTRYRSRFSHATAKYMKKPQDGCHWMKKFTSTYIRVERKRSTRKLSCFFFSINFNQPFDGLRKKNSSPFHTTK